MVGAMIRALLLLGLVAGTPACDPPPYDTSGGAPSIRIIFPESSTEVVYCSTFQVSVAVENFTLSEADYGGANVDGEGHWHLLDGDTVLKATADEYAYIPTDMPLSDGDHVIKAELVQNDHQPLTPEISWISEITVNNEAVDDTATDTAYEGCIGGGTDGGTAYH